MLAAIWYIGTSLTAILLSIATGDVNGNSERNIEIAPSGLVINTCMNIMGEIATKVKIPTSC